MASGRLRIGHGSPSSRILTAEYGQYNLSGQDAGLVYADSGSNIVTVTGTGFGTKPIAAPHFYQRFTDTNTGDNYAAAGFDFLGLNTTTEVSQVRMDETFNGAGTWRTNNLGNGGETFTHFGVFMPSNNDRVTCMFWRRMVRTGSGGGQGQIKGMRAGRAGSDIGPSDGNAMYSVTPRWASSDYIDDLSDVTPPMLGGNPVPHYWQAPPFGSGSEINIPPDSEDSIHVQDGNYHFLYHYMQLNTLGNANGIYVLRYGDTLYLNNTTQQIKSLDSHYIDYCQPNPGYAGSFATCAFSIYHTYIYIDNSRAWAGFGDSPDFDACSGFIPLNLSSWSNTQIVGDLGGLGRPTGFDYMHVMTSAGSVIENVSYS